MSRQVNIRVLHVDDEPGFADMTAELLKREDHRFAVETATSTSEGLNQLASDDFDCIVSDYDMPGQNGIEFLKSVRKRAPNLPFVLFTGKGSEEIAGEAISAGVTDYLQKNSGTDQYTVLANRLRNAVQRHRAEKDRKRQRKAIETAQEGISILNEAGEYIYVALLKSYFLDTFLVRIVVRQVWDCSLEKSPVSIDNYASVLHKAPVGRGGNSPVPSKLSCYFR